MNEQFQKVLDCLKRNKKIIIFSTIIFLVIIIIATAVCSGESEAQRGYRLSKEDLEMSLYAPDTLEITKVYCFETILAENLVSNSVDYVYKICYSAESKAGLKINNVVYYGYREYSKSVIYYGTDSSIFDSESTFNKLIKIRY